MLSQKTLIILGIVLGVLACGLLLGLRDRAIESAQTVTVVDPQPNDEIGYALHIKMEELGTRTIRYRLKDSAGKVLVGGPTNESDIYLSYPAPTTTDPNGTLDLFEYSTQDGSEINKVTIPIKFPQGEALTVQVFFSNSERDPMHLDCAKVYPFDRRIAKTSATAQATIAELLKGPYDNEKSLLYFTSIPQGVVVNSVTIANGTAKVDFNKNVEEGGGSCSMAARTSQIRQTLLQFPSIKQVILSVEGKTDPIFQP
jgi:hypothetical protein